MTHQTAACSTTKMKVLFYPMLSIVALMTTAAAFAQPASGAPDAPPGTPISVKLIPGFENATTALKLLATQRKGAAVNHFCVVGYPAPASGQTIAWVHWVEKKSLVLWEPVAAGGKAQLSRSRRYLNLVTDVVATDEDLHASSYLVTKAWVARVLSDCKQAGQHYIVKR